VKSDGVALTEIVWGMLALHYLDIRVNWLLRGRCLDAPNI
jgi:hypothetical protein